MLSLTLYFSLSLSQLSAEAGLLREHAADRESLALRLDIVTADLESTQQRVRVLTELEPRCEAAEAEAEELKAALELAERRGDAADAACRRERGRAEEAEEALEVVSRERAELAATNNRYESVVEHYTENLEAEAKKQRELRASARAQKELLVQLGERLEGRIKACEAADAPLRQTETRSRRSSRRPRPRAWRSSLRLRTVLRMRFPRETRCMRAWRS
jgi:chromosome segregation ATPase